MIFGSKVFSKVERHKEKTEEQRGIFTEIIVLSLEGRRNM